ncbi:MAG: PQQ-dependent sugar dehydrogenase [Deltaproteobacteria bacterium]|nr:PQQ-dependent sugar dehydrogenase [Deltaproteobacteria bacterium]
MLARSPARLGLAFAVLAAGCGGSSSTTTDAAVIDGASIDGPPGDASPFTDATFLPDGGPIGCTPAAGSKVASEVVVGGLSSPLLVTGPAGDPRLFVIEQSGKIKIVRNGAVDATPFLDLTIDNGGPVNDSGNEQGLLGLAFHPDYQHNGRFYVNYTRTPDGDTVIAEYTVSGNPDIADPASAREVLVINQPFSNHNGGMIEFGPKDGYLYIGMGDGGDADDPMGNGQNLSAMLGKMLRIDVDTRTGSKAYGIPPTNPYAGSADGANDPRPEIWARGLRNPYRWGFDPTTGTLIIGDVGQGLIEEVDLQAPGQGAGANYGWDVWEGNDCHEPPQGQQTCSAAGFVKPLIEQTHGDGWCSVIGGAVYRGACFPDLDGQYFYTDFCKHDLHEATLSGTALTGDTARGTGFGASPTSIHASGTGELYITLRGGEIRRITATP